MSEEEKGKPTVCDHFEPQAWRKTVCKNCFQHPDAHPAGSGQYGGGDTSGEVCRDQQRDGSAEKGEKSAAALLKNKYEQLERDKYKPKEVESHTLPRTKKASGLALITEKYDQLDRLAGRLESPTKSGPPPTPPKTYKKDKDGGGLTKFKFGSVENVSSDFELPEGKLGLKLKFGSMENISLGHDKQKEPAPIPIQKAKDKASDISTKPEVKVSSSTDKTSSKTEGKVSSTDKLDNKSKFEKPELKSAGKDDDKILSKFGLKSKTDLKSPTPDKDKPPDFKQAKESLSSLKVGDSKTVLGKLKNEEKSDDKSVKSGFQKPEVKQTKTDKEENILSSLKDKLNKPSTAKDKEDSKVGALLKANQETSSKTDITKIGEKKTPALNLKDMLKSPESDSTPLSKFKDKLKSPTVDDAKQVPSWKDKLKSPVADKDTKPDFKLKHDLKSPTPEKDKIPEFQLKAQLRSSKEEKDHGLKNQLLPKKTETEKKLEPKGRDIPKTPENDNKIGFNYRDNLKSKTTDKKSADDLKKKTDNKDTKHTSEDTKTSTNKVFDLRSGLKKSGDKEPEKTDSKAKVGFPGLKSKTESSVSDKSQLNKGKFGAKDDKTPGKIESKFKFGKLDSKADNEEKKKEETKSKFGNLKLKPPANSKESESSKPTSKSKWEAKETDSPSVTKNKFEIPALKKIKSPEPEKDSVILSKSGTTKTDVHLDKTNLAKENETDKNRNDERKDAAKIKDKTNEETISDKTPAKSETSDSRDFQENKDDKKESPIQKSELLNSISTPNTSDIRKKSFEEISSDREAVSSDACALEFTREKSPLHVDTQVFTNTRSRTAGVSDFDDKQFDNIDNASGFSKLDSVKSKNTSLEKDTKGFLVNGDISTEHEESKFEKEELDKKAKTEDNFSREIENLKSELINMTERCQNLETENEMLRTDLNKKGMSEMALRKQRDEVENLIKGLKTQLKSLEDKCVHLETENINLLNDMKAKHDANQSKPQTKEAEELDERLTSKEKIMEDMLEENEQLKQEINELKVEMEEMYDSFRDQEAEEFREMQKELEFTAKNCRILQFKMRKLERRNEQLEQDKNQFEDRLRKLQNSFQDRDAVAHIHSLEDELRMAKEVSVRLHDELDLMEDRRTKVEEENRHLTELLEQADRKQFRLELEVDKLRDKVVELRQELRTREGGPEGEEPRKLNCSEFLALHRGTI